MVRTRALRPAAFVGLLLASVVGGLALAPAAFAHHPDISGTAACDSSVTFTSTAWVAGSAAERTNPKIAIAYAVNGSNTFTTLAQKATYRFDSANHFTFTDTFTPPAGWTSVKLRATAAGAWADGAGPGDTRTSSSIAKATGCTTPTTAPPTTTPPTTTPPTTPPTTTPTPPTTTVGSTSVPTASVADASCTNHLPVAHLATTGDVPVTFTIVVNGGAPTLVTAAPHQGVEVQVPVPAEASATVVISAPGMTDVRRVLDTTCAGGVAAGGAVQATPVPTPAPAPTTTPAAPAVAASTGNLPRTGIAVGTSIAFAVAALLAGLGLVLVTRKQRAV